MVLYDLFMALTFVTSSNSHNVPMRFVELTLILPLRNVNFSELKQVRERH